MCNMLQSELAYISPHLLDITSSLSRWSTSARQ